MSSNKYSEPITIESGCDIRTSISDKFEALALDYEYAKKLAAEKHSKQKYGSKEYTYHLDKTEKVLKRFGYDPDKSSEGDRELCWNLITSAWLHDIVEDTDMTQSEISKRFNCKVSSLVYAVTNPSGGNRAWRASMVYPKIYRTPNAIILKMADRIANIEESISTRNSTLKMYKKEWPTFKEKYTNLVDQNDERQTAMWNYIENMLEK